MAKASQVKVGRSKHSCTNGEAGNKVHLCPIWWLWKQSKPFYGGRSGLDKGIPFLVFDVTSMIRVIMGMVTLIKIPKELKLWSNAAKDAKIKHINR